MRGYNNVQVCLQHVRGNEGDWSYSQRIGLRWKYQRINWILNVFTLLRSRWRDSGWEILTPLFFPSAHLSDLLFSSSIIYISMLRRLPKARKKRFLARRIKHFQVSNNTCLLINKNNTLQLCSRHQKGIIPRGWITKQKEIIIELKMKWRNYKKNWNWNLWKHPQFWELPASQNANIYLNQFNSGPQMDSVH